jgi:hypothetical protein
MSKLGGNVKDGIETMFLEDPLHKRAVAKVSLEAGKAGKRILILLEVDVDDRVTFMQEPTLENSTEEA